MQVSRALDYLRHTLGQTPGLEGKLILNQAGRHLTGMHAWAWLERPAVQLSELAPITVSAATWTESTLTLVATSPASAFANYTWRGGDRFNVTGGTGATIGSYPIASKTNATTIVLGESIGAAANGQTNIAGNIVFPYVQLPADFRELIALRPTEGLVNSCQPATLSEILAMRYGGVPVGNQTRYFAISYQQALASTGGAMVPRLELYPTPSAADQGVLSLVYRAGWTEIDDDAEFISVPLFMEGLYLQLAGTFARGLEEEDEATLNTRLSELHVGPIFQAAVRDDSGMMPSAGPLRNGVGQRYFSSWPYDYTYVSNPA